MPILGEVIEDLGQTIKLHVIYGIPSKMGAIVNVSAKNLQSYKVTKFQLKHLFPGGSLPDALEEKGEAYLITDKPGQYPDFSSVLNPNNMNKNNNLAGEIIKGSMGNHPSQFNNPKPSFF